MPESKHFARLDRRYLLLAGLFLLAVYVVLPQLGDFKQSRHLLAHPDWLWVSLALVLTGLTYFFAAATYCLLSFTRLKYFETALVQLAVMFINRLLPGGIGALGANYLYLHKKGNTSAQAGVAVAINNALGFIGHNLLFAGTVIIAGSSSLAMRHNSNFAWLKLAVLAVLVVLLAAALLGRNKVLKALADLKTQLFEYRHRLGRLGLALFSSMGLTLANILCLLACAQALGVDLSFAPVFLVFSFGLSAGTVTPTPGGLGGFEAGLAAGFIAYGVPASTALAIALLYRLISYWLPLFVGAGALVISQRKHLF